LGNEKKSTVEYHLHKVQGNGGDDRTERSSIHNAWILLNFQIDNAVKVTAAIISTQNLFRRNSKWAPFALITIISLFGS